MSAPAIPATCSTALKEWATVLEAMSRGEQLVLIRKGGLLEPGSGFEMVSEPFLFYPTFEHQAVHYLRPPYQAYFDQALARRAPEGMVRFELVGCAMWSTESRDPSVVERLQAFHIYNESFIAQRLRWKPDQPLAIVVVRVFRLAEPKSALVLPSYAGCKSWVALDSTVPLANAQPVLDDAQFERRLQDVRPLLAADPARLRRGHPDGHLLD